MVDECDLKLTVDGTVDMDGEYIFRSFPLEGVRLVIGPSELKQTNELLKEKFLRSLQTIHNAN